MPQYPALEAFAASLAVADIRNVSPEVAKEIQAILDCEPLDGKVGAVTLKAFADWKASVNQGQPTVLGNASARMLIEKGTRPAPTHPPAVQRQIDRLSTYLPPSKALNLNISAKYFSQRDNYTQPHRTCNSSSHAMYLDWLMRVTGRPGLETDDKYLRTIMQNGIDTTVHEAHTVAIKQYGFSTKWNTDSDAPFVKTLIDAGFPVTCNILHRGSRQAPRGGHIIMLVGRKDGYFLAHDPYGTLESDYSATNGKHSRISESEWGDRWQGGYRILA